jgi:hypothetical protein
MNAIAPSQRHDTFPDGPKHDLPEEIGAANPRYA